MLIGETVRGSTIASTWEQGLALFAVPERLYRHDSERGVAFEIPSLTLVVDSVLEDGLPDRYAYPSLVDEYLERVFGNLQSESLLYERLRRWRTVGGECLDQVAALTLELGRRPDTRAAAFSLWRPEVDLSAAFPVSPVAGCFRVIEGEVHLQLVARSVDYWLGAVPELVAFARLQADVAASVDLTAGRMVYQVWSAHIYESDYLANVAGGGSH